MFLKDRNGNRMEVNLKANAPASKVVENYENKSEGSNKMLLYIALFIGLAVAIGSGYMLLKNKPTDSKMKSRENFGYRLH